VQNKTIFDILWPKYIEEAGMRKGEHVVFCIFLVSLLLPIVVWASYPLIQYPNVPAIEKMRPNGQYSIYVIEGGKWQEVGELLFDEFYREREIDLSGYMTRNEIPRIRLVQQGGGASHIDSAFLGDKPPVEVKDIEDGLKKLSKTDFDVIDAFHKSIEIAFPSNKNKRILKLTARVENAMISKVPFQFPSANLYKEISPASSFYTYEIGNRKAESSFFQEYSLTGSGHPSGYTYGWVWNDEKNLHVRIDFTPDDTMDGDKDYAKVYIKTEGGIKGFKVSVPETRWGKTSFIYTDKVAYQHKVYDFTIPLKEIGIKDATKAVDLKLAFAAYGTATPTGSLFFEIDPPGGGTIDITLCSQGTCVPSPPVTCPPNCQLACQSSPCEANYLANTNPGYTFLGFDICGQQISPEQNPWTSGWSSGDPPCTIRAHFQQTRMAVPTITQWGMIIFMVLAGLGAVYFISRKLRAKN
jgi:hypothetical protein